MILPAADERTHPCHYRLLSLVYPRTGGRLAGLRSVDSGLLSA